MGNQFPAGSRIREYEILDLVGHGGMGAVYRARHVYLNKIRAIKVIHTTLATDQEFAERFIREARILSELNHPNLVALYEFGTLDDGTFFMVLEFVQGESLLQRIRRRGKIPLEDSIPIIRDSALGLHSAHMLGIVHRDISPDNILLVRESNGTEIPKVIDFGIAKTLMETRQFTATSMFIGKPEYCSPEQAGLLPEGQNIDYRSDIYSLAVTLYHTLSGKLPFYSPTPQGYLVKHATESPKSILDHFTQGEVPPELDPFFRRALAKNRDERFVSMQEFAQELMRIQNAAEEQHKAIAQLAPEEAFQAAFQRGKDAFDRLEWHEAIRAWIKALSIRDDENVQQWIAAAQERLQTEVDIRNRISQDLDECERMLQQTNFHGASAILDRVQSNVTHAGLEEYNSQVQTLRDRLRFGAQAPPPVQKTRSNASYWIGGVLAFFFMSILTIGVILYSISSRKIQGQRAALEETERYIQEDRFAEARDRLNDLPELGIPSSSIQYQDLENRLREREVLRATTLLQEAESAVRSGDLTSARDKMRQLRELHLQGYEKQIASLEEAMQNPPATNQDDYNAIGKKSRTPLMRALYDGDLEKARALLNNGAGVNDADANGYTVLMYSLWRAPALAEELIRGGAFVNARDNRGVEPIHVAADTGNADAVSLLIRSGSNINALNGFGYSPLIIASMQGHMRVARLLIDSGADLTITTPNGYDALRTAEYYNRYEIAEMIRAAGSQH